MRTFKGGVSIFYEGSNYLRYEIAFKTEVWENGLKEYEYDAKFGALDIETYNAEGSKGYGLQIPYAAGFTDYQGNTTMFYIEEGESDYVVLVRTLQALLCSKYSGGSFYVHNMGRFDSRLIFEALGMMSDVSCRLWGRDMSNIFKIRISRKVGNKQYNITLLDSVYQLPFKLDVLGKKFNTEVKKSTFPYSFVNKNTLFYIGETPGIKYYNRNLTDTEYRELFKNS